MKNKEYVIKADKGTKEIFCDQDKFVVGATIIGFLVKPYDYKHCCMDEEDSPFTDALVGSITYNGIGDMGASGDQLKGVIFPDGTVEILGGVFETLQDAQEYYDEESLKLKQDKENKEVH